MKSNSKELWDWYDGKTPGEDNEWHPVGEIYDTLKDGTPIQDTPLPFQFRHVLMYLLYALIISPLCLIFFYGIPYALHITPNQLWLP